MSLVFSMLITLLLIVTFWRASASSTGKECGTTPFGW